VRAGVDDDEDQVLDQNEVTSTSYVCDPYVYYGHVVAETWTAFRTSN
jgi:hypothetical protein